MPEAACDLSIGDVEAGESFGLAGQSAYRFNKRPCHKNLGSGIKAQAFHLYTFNPKIETGSL